MSTEHTPSPTHPTQSVESPQQDPVIQELPYEPDGSASPNGSENNTPYQTPDSDSTLSSNTDIVYDYSTVIINQDEVVVLERKTPVTQDSYGEDSNSNTASQQDTDYTNVIVTEGIDNAESSVQEDVNESTSTVTIQEVEIESIPQDKETEPAGIPSQESNDTGDTVTPMECSQFSPSPTQEITMDYSELPSDPPQDTDVESTLLPATPEVLVTQEPSYRDTPLLTQSQDLTPAVSQSAPAECIVSSHPVYRYCVTNQIMY